MSFFDNSNNVELAIQKVSSFPAGPGGPAGGPAVGPVINPAVGSGGSGVVEPPAYAQSFTPRLPSQSPPPYSSVGHTPPPPSYSMAQPILKSKLQITLPNKLVLSREFSGDDTLWTVYEYIATQGGIGDVPVNLLATSTYPNKQYSVDSFDVSLKEAGLVPSGILSVVVVKGGAR